MSDSNPPPQGISRSLALAYCQPDAPNETGGRDARATKCSSDRDLPVLGTQAFHDHHCGKKDQDHADQSIH